MAASGLETLRSMEEVMAEAFVLSPKAPRKAVLHYLSTTAGQLAKTLKKEGHPCTALMLETLFDDWGYQLHRTRARAVKKETRVDQFERIAKIAMSAVQSRAPLIYSDTQRITLPKDAEGPLDLRAALEMVEAEVARPFISVGGPERVSAIVASAIEHWWVARGRLVFSSARMLAVCSGGDLAPITKARPEPWQASLQTLSNGTGLQIHMRHFPPGVSNWGLQRIRIFEAVTFALEPGEVWHTRVDVLVAPGAAAARLQPCQTLIDAESASTPPFSKKSLNITHEGRPAAWSYLVKPKR